MADQFSMALIPYSGWHLTSSEASAKRRSQQSLVGVDFRPIEIKGKSCSVQSGRIKLSTEVIKHGDRRPGRLPEVSDRLIGCKELEQPAHWLTGPPCGPADVEIYHLLFVMYRLRCLPVHRSATFRYTSSSPMK